MTCDIRRVRQELDRLWDIWWSGTPPLGDELRGMHSERWVRFHALPQSKRYPESEEEYGIVLARHHALLDALGLDGHCFVTAQRYFDDLKPPENPGLPTAVHWRTLPAPWDEEINVAVYVAAMTYPSDELDGLLRAVVDEQESGVIIAPAGAGGWLYHPYDGGADVIAPSRDVRDELADRFSAWLSPHPLGL
jgi:hypothetical protein